MDSFLVDILLLVLATEHATACWSGNNPDTIQNPDKKEVNLTDADLALLGRNINQSWGGWTQPDSVRQQWKQWLQNYKADQAATKGPKEYAEERQDYPDSWRDLGGGEGGDNPPPWAYGPVNTGLPDFCYMKPEKGNCTDNLIRWGFNPYTNECQQFNFSGCGENRNNFIIKLRCEQACMLEPISGCETEAHINPEDINQY